MKHLPAPARLRVNLLSSPFGIRRDRLAFSWVMAQAPGARQTAYRITVARGANAVADGRYLYDSGWVLSSQCASVRPKGLSACLEGGVLYYWQVAVRDGAGCESLLSPPQAFTLAEEELCARGIWAEEGDFAFLRSAFSLTEAEHTATDRALVTVTATSPEPSRQFVYNLSINGTEVGLGPCRIGATPDGSPVIYCQTYDVTSLLRAGENCLGAICYALADKGFFCRLTLFDRAGTPRVLTDTGTSPEAWRALCGDGVFGKSNSIGTHYFVAHACNISAPAYPFGFAEAGFDEGGEHGGHVWTPARVVGALMGGLPLLPSDTEPVSRYATPARTVTPLGDGGYLVDLGAEIIGGLRWAVNAPHTCEVTLTYGEQLAGGHVKCPMNTGNTYREVWTLMEGRQTLETLGMMAFRYVEIHGFPAEVTPDALWGLEIRKPFTPEASALTTSHPLLAELYTLVKHTVRVTSQDIYVDSQSRERGAYEGDLLINMLAAYALEDSFAPARLTTEYLLGHRTWPADYLLMIIYAARADYLATGDASLLHDWYDVLRGNLFLHCIDGTGLVRSPVIGQSTTNAVLVDWPPSERDGYEMDAPYNTVFNALHVRALRAMAEIAAITGHDADALTFSLQADDLTRTMIGRLYDPASGRFCDGLREDGTPSPHAAGHATAFCLSCGIFSDAAMADRMAAALASDGEIRMSVYASFFLLEGLYQSGHGALANALMLSSDDREGVFTERFELVLPVTL